MQKEMVCYSYIVKNVYKVKQYPNYILKRKMLTQTFRVLEKLSVSQISFKELKL